jgi:hypothetical protein
MTENKYTVGSSGDTAGEAGVQVDYNEYDIDPPTLETATRNVWRDRASGRQHALVQMKEMDFWVGYSAEGAGSDADNVEIDGVGEVSLNPISLDMDALEAAIIEHGEALIADSAVEQAGEQLTQNATGIATTLAEAWEALGEDTLDTALNQGTASTNGELVWVRRDSDLFASEVETAFDEYDIQDTDDGRVFELLQDTLAEISGDVEGLPESVPSATYSATLNMKGAPWIARAVAIRQNGGLYPQNARVAALYEHRSMQIDVADELGISSSNVHEQVKRLKKNVEEAQWMVDNLSHFVDDEDDGEGEAGDVASSE